MDYEKNPYDFEEDIMGENVFIENLETKSNICRNKNWKLSPMNVDTKRYL